MNTPTEPVCQCGRTKGQHHWAPPYEQEDTLDGFAACEGYTQARITDTPWQWADALIEGMQSHEPGGVLRHPDPQERERAKTLLLESIETGPDFGTKPWLLRRIRSGSMWRYTP